MVIAHSNVMLAKKLGRFQLLVFNEPKMLATPACHCEYLVYLYIYISIYLSIYFKMHLMYIMEYGEENMRGYTHAIYYIDESLLRD